MRIPVLVQPDFRGSLWCRQILEGLSAEAARKKYGLCFFESADALPEALLAHLPSRLALVVGTAVSWVPGVQQALSDRGVGTVLIGCAREGLPGVRGALGGDPSNVIRGILGYLRGCGRTRPALYGINPNSDSDEHYRRAFVQQCGAPDPDACVFYNRADLARCFEDFYARRAGFDAVFCPNDPAAVSLQNRLSARGVRLPEELYIIGSGNSHLCSLVRPTLSSFTLDNGLGARRALDLYVFLLRQPPEVCVDLYGEGRLCPRESTGGHPWNPAPAAPCARSADPVDFYSDPEAAALLSAEAFLAQLEPLDFELLALLRAGRPLEPAADGLHTTASTLRYRLKRMESLSGTSGRAGLLAFLARAGVGPL